jgi:hypothetical protein
LQKKRQGDNWQEKHLFNCKSYHGKIISLDSYLGDSLIRSSEIPDGGKTKNQRKYSRMEFLKPKTPKKLTFQYIIQNAEYSIQSQSKNWKIWAWRQIVIIKVAGMWDPDIYPYHFSDFWDIFCERKRYWDPVYFIVEANDMPIQSVEFRNYVKTNWQHLIEREDFRLCIVEEKAMKRAIWRSIYTLLGIQDKVKIFENHNQVFMWAQKQSLSSRL